MHFHLIYLIFTTFGSVAVLLYSLRHLQTRGSKSLAYVCVSAIVWMLGETVGVVATNITGQFIGEIIRFAGVVSMPVCLLTFISRYCGIRMSPGRIIGFSVIPAISLGMMITTPQHGLFFAQMQANTIDGPLLIRYGPYFWFVHLPYSYLLIASCLVILLFEINRVSQRFRTQIILLFVSICIPIGINILNLSGLFQGVNLNPIGFLGFLAVSSISIFRFQLLKGNPIAYETVFKTTPDGVIILNKDSTIMDINPAAARGLGKKRKKLIGRNVNEVFAAWKPFSSSYDGDVETYDELELEMRGARRYFSLSKKPVTNTEGEVTGRIMTIRNITTQKQHQISLETLAFHDPLTMLGNRRKFEEEFEVAIKRADRRDKRFAVLYFDLNSFKKVNDTLGHKIGDELLKYVAARIASILRKPDIVARLGGDEFAAILYNANEQGVRIAVERIIENTKTPFKIKGHVLVADLSIGASFYPDHGKTQMQLLNHADTAMYRAKSFGGGLAVFDASIDSPNVLNM